MKAQEEILKKKMYNSNQIRFSTPKSLPYQYFEQDFRCVIIQVTYRSKENKNIINIVDFTAIQIH